jgi:hypothetical protein
VSDVELYEIASESERELHAKNASSIADPARRRETKIKQYQAEKEIRSRIEVKTLIRSYPHPILTHRSFTGRRATTPTPILRFLPDRL